MTNESSGSVAARYKALLAVVEKNFKYLDSIGLDAQLSQDYKRLISHMRSASLVEMYSVLDKKSGPKKNQNDAVAQMSNEEIGKLTLAEIKQKITSASVPRSSIEKLASVRFGVSRSGLTSLKSRDALVNKIENLLSNEGAHEIITRSASVAEDSKKEPS
jgi:hypothetical protein